MVSHLSQIFPENFKSFIGPAPSGDQGEGKRDFGDGEKVLIGHGILPALTISTALCWKRQPASLRIGRLNNRLIPSSCQAPTSKDRVLGSMVHFLKQGLINRKIMILLVFIYVGKVRDGFSF